MVLLRQMKLLSATSIVKIRSSKFAPKWMKWSDALSLKFTHVLLLVFNALFQQSISSRKSSFN